MVRERFSNLFCHALYELLAVYLQLQFPVGGFNMATESPSESAKTSFYVRGCKINRAQLDKLVELAAKDLGSKNLKLTTTRKSNDVTFTSTGTSVDELLQSLEKSIPLEGAARIYNLVIHVAGSQNSCDEIYIKINDPESSRKNVAVSIAGRDSEWVIGRRGLLRELFSSTRSKFVAPINNVRYYTTLPTVALAVLLTFPILSFLNVSNSLEIKAVTATTLAVLMGLPAYSLGSKIDYASRTEFLIPQPSTRKTHDWIDIAILIATVMTALLAAISIRITSGPTHSPSPPPSPSFTKTPANSSSPSNRR